MLYGITDPELAVSWHGEGRLSAKPILEGTSSHVATFYRIIKSDHSTRWDFQSAQERGQQFRRPLDPESLRISFGISVYDSLDAAIANARLRPYLGTHVVPIEIEDGGPIRAEQTTRKRHHHTLFGPADEILHRAGSPIPIAEYT